MRLMYDFQSDAVADIVRWANAIMEKRTAVMADGTQHYVSLVGTTGCGKTTIGAFAVLEFLRSRPHERWCVLWIAPSKGGLPKEAQREIAGVIGGTVRCFDVSEEFSGGSEAFSPNEMGFLGWDAINKVDGGTGDFMNRLMRDSEGFTLIDTLERTRENGINILLVVDESHWGTETARTQGLIKMIRPSLTFYLSATPSFRPSPDDIQQLRAMEVRVDTERVKAAGLIKKDILYNSGLGGYANLASSVEAVLSAALAKRSRLRSLYRYAGRNVNPLILVQLPSKDRDGGNITRETCERFLASQGITYENGRLAVWLANERKNTESIRNLDGEAEVLLFKHAIDLGWDCPRAQILVIFSGITSEEYGFQLIGRIIRMPERWHYDIDELNYGYVYTNDEKLEAKLRKIGGEDGYTEIRRRTDVMPLRSFSKERRGSVILDSDYSRLFKAVMATRYGLAGTSDDGKRLVEAGFSFETDRATRRALGETVQDVVDIGKTTIASKDHISLNMDDQDAEVLFRRLLAESVRGVQGLDPAKHAIYGWFGKLLGTRDISRIQRLAVLNKDKLAEVLVATTEQFRKLKRDLAPKGGQSMSGFVPPTILKVNTEESEEIPDVPNYLYERCFLKKAKSRNEIAFEDFLMSLGDKIRWWKNLDGGDGAFGIEYEYDGEIHVFCPDYLIWNAKADGCFIAEVKDRSDPEAKTVTKAKAEAMHAYIAEEQRRGVKVAGGIVIPWCGIMWVNNDPVYDADSLERWKRINDVLN